MQGNHFFAYYESVKNESELNAAGEAAVNDFDSGPMRADKRSATARGAARLLVHGRDGSQCNAKELGSAIMAAMPGSCVTASGH